MAGRPGEKGNIMYTVHHSKNSSTGDFSLAIQRLVSVYLPN